MPAQAWVTLIIGVVGFAGVIGGILQKIQSDKRAEWWKRATWAVDHTLSDNLDAQILGFDVIGKLQTSRLITAADRDLFAAWLTPQALADDSEPTAADNEGEEAR